jgi:PhzF family phenazine biosynthesis protein
VTAPEVHLVRVFAASQTGGNPAPVVLHADGLSSDAMRGIAAREGLESAFVLRPEQPGNSLRLRFFVPNHEMEMCGHATLGALWLLRSLGTWTSDVAQIETPSGIVLARVDPDSGRIEISQPEGRVAPVAETELVRATLAALGLDKEELQFGGIVNAATSRTKTLIGLRTCDRLHGLKPKFDAIETLCDALGSTGLYPFAIESDRPLRLQARQFPRSSGYPEDAATGIAAAALLYGAFHYGIVKEPAEAVIVHQGFAMGSPSEIELRFRNPADPSQGCWLSGAVELMKKD